MSSASFVFPELEESETFVVVGGKSYMGINAKVVIGGEVKVVALAVTRSYGSATSDNIQSVVLEALEKYELSIFNVTTVTTDGGANVLRASRHLVARSLLGLDEDLEDESDFERSGDSDNPLEMKRRQRKTGIEAITALWNRRFDDDSC